MRLLHTIRPGKKRLTLRISATPKSAEAKAAIRRLVREARAFVKKWEVLRAKQRKKSRSR